MNIKKVTFKLRESEIKMLEALQGKDLGTSEVFRHALRLYYKKEFPAYTVKSDIEDKSPEEKCTAMGGKVKTEHGIKICEYPLGKATATIPLDQLE